MNQPNCKAAVGSENGKARSLL